MRDFNAGHPLLLIVTIASSSTLFRRVEAAGDMFEAASGVPEAAVQCSSKADEVEQRPTGSSSTYSNPQPLSTYPAPFPQALPEGVYAVPRRVATQQRHEIFNKEDVQCSHYDFPKSHAGSVMQCQSLGCDCPPKGSNLYDTPKPSTGLSSRRGSEGSPTRLGGADPTSSHSHSSAANSALRTKQPTVEDFDWLRAEIESDCKYWWNSPYEQFVEPVGYRTLAGTSRHGGSTEGRRVSVERSLSVTLPSSLRSRSKDSLRRTLSPPPDLAHGSARQPAKAPCPSGLSYEVIDALLNETPLTTTTDVDRKTESRGILARCPFFLKGKTRKPAHGTPAAEKLSASGGTAAVSSQTKALQGSASTVTEATKDSRRAQRELPPLPTVEPRRSEDPQQTRKREGAYPDNSTGVLARWDQLIREKLSTEVLHAVLICEQRILKALRAGTLMELLSTSAGADEFAFFAHVTARFTDGLNLTPPERLFIMWAQECPKLSNYCSRALLIEMVYLFEFIAGVRPLEVPPAVKVLLSSGAARERGFWKSASPPAPAPGGTVLPSRLSEAPFTLFFHRISSDFIRRETVGDLVCSWSQFAAEVKSLIFRKNIQKSLDYPSYRTRFIVYTYTAAALGLKEGDNFYPQSTTDPVEDALRNCFKDTSMARRIADPEVRGKFFDAIRVTHF